MSPSLISWAARTTTNTCRIARIGAILQNCLKSAIMTRWGSLLLTPTNGVIIRRGFSVDASMRLAGLKKGLEDPHVFPVFFGLLAFRGLEDHRVLPEPGVV